MIRSNDDDQLRSGQVHLDDTGFGSIYTQEEELHRNNLPRQKDGRALLYVTMASVKSFVSVTTDHAWMSEFDEKVCGGSNGLKDSFYQFLTEEIGEIGAHETVDFVECI